jgi:pimeloyl-ACP methyl ester carboxylesterase
MLKNILHEGKKVYYRKQGVGKAVMLIHGFGEDGTVWDKQVKALSDIYTLLIPDLPGAGSSVLNADVSMEGQAVVLYKILQAEGIDNIILAGHSMGGYIALAFAEMYGAILKGLSLFHSSAYADNDAKKESRKKSIEFIKNHGSYEFLKQSSPKLFSEAYQQNNPAAITSLIEHNKNFNPHALVAYYEAMMARPNRTHVLESIKVPVLFIVGKHDTAIPYDDSMKQCNLPELSYITVLNQSGHMGMWEEEDLSNTSLIHFLNSI